MPKTRAELYHQAGNHPIAWWRVGENLIVSSNLLWTAVYVSMPADMDLLDELARQDLWRAQAVLGPMLMLRAFGLEAMFKALFLDGGGVLARDGRFRSPTQRPHDLRALAAAAGISVSAEEDAILGSLEYWIEEGRYPILANISKYDRASLGLPLKNEWSPEAESVLQALLKRLYDHAKPRWERWTTWGQGKSAP